MANIVEAPECDGGARRLHRGREPSYAKQLNILLRVYAQSSRATAKVHVCNEDTINVKHLDASNGTRRCRASLCPMSKVDFQTEVSQSKPRPKSTGPSLVLRVRDLEFEW